MEIQPDFKEFLELLNKNNVEYLIVGGYAMALHGSPRFTGDIDIFIANHRENALKITHVLKEFGFGSLPIHINDFCKPENIIQLGVPPVRIDILTSLSGVFWDEAKKGAIKGDYGGIPVYFIGKKELIKNKKATNRKKDLADLEALGEE